jgi:hypothetical protein
MPSYIELDKQASFPPSSNIGKLIFGVNTSGDATLTNVNGVTSVIGGGGGNTCNQSPCPNDYILLNSYGAWIYGESLAPLFERKFEIIANEYDTSDYLTLEFVGGRVNNCNISKCEYSSITVNYTNLIYRDDGYGLTVVNYVDYINAIFSGQGLYTTISGTSSPSFRSNFCVLDDFTLTFKDYGQLNGIPLNQKYFTITGRYGLNIGDSFANDFTSINQILYGFNFFGQLIPWQL